MTDVLDASVVLAVLLEEVEGDLWRVRLRGGTISAVNYSEAIELLMRRGATASDAMVRVASFDFQIVSFGIDLAERAAALAAQTRGTVLSFGDRACLALAAQLGATALTADRKWSEVDLGIAVEQIR